MTTTTSSSWKISQRFIGWFLVVCAAIGLLASFTLLHETFAVAEDPSYVPSCNINPFLSCKSVMASAESKLLFGIPNPAFGIAAFTALLVFAVLLLLDTKFKPVVWYLGIAAATLGFLSVVGLYLSSLLTLGTICPWCFVTWLVTIAIFWVILTHSFAAKQVTLPTWLKGFASFWTQYATVILASLYVILFFGILLRFHEVLFA